MEGEWYRGFCARGSTIMTIVKDLKHGCKTIGIAMDVAVGAKTHWYVGIVKKQWASSGIWRLGGDNTKNRRRFGVSGGTTLALFYCFL